MLSVATAVDALNFLSADVRNLFGPFINVFLVASRHWTETDVGLIMTGSGLLGIALQTPIGAAIDVARAKRGVIVGVMEAMTFCALIIYAFTPLRLSDVLADVVRHERARARRRRLRPCRGGPDPRSGDEEGARPPTRPQLSHGGNIAVALVAGGVGTLFSQRVVFLLMPLFAALTAASVMMIPAESIDHDRARDLSAFRSDAPWPKIRSHAARANCCSIQRVASARTVRPSLP